MLHATRIQCLTAHACTSLHSTPVQLSQPCGLIPQILLIEGWYMGQGSTCRQTHVQVQAYTCTCMLQSTPTSALPSGVTRLTYVLLPDQKFTVSSETRLCICHLHLHGSQLPAAADLGQGIEGSAAHPGPVAACAQQPLYKVNPTCVPVPVAWCRQGREPLTAQEGAILCIPGCRVHIHTKV